MLETRKPRLVQLRGNHKREQKDENLPNHYFHHSTFSKPIRLLE
nr:MAG TPA: hypothetical protein [Caudoviricetes sp.]